MEIIVYLAILLVGILMFTLIVRDMEHKEVNPVNDMAQTDESVDREYSIYVTDYLTEKDCLNLRPLFMLKYSLKNNTGETYLCKVIGGKGEKTLSEAVDSIREELHSCANQGALLEAKVVNENDMTEGELEILRELSAIK
jgi:hypothetical protein